jgi:hypothetical protein
MYSKWDNFELPQLTELGDYGINWPKGTAQVTKELGCFKMLREGKKGKHLMPAMIHYLNIMRLLHPKMVELYKDVPKGRIWNNYFLDIAELITDFSGSGQERSLITGPASANKTYCVASYAHTSFMMAPLDTMVMVSTTSGTASERRIWADIKDFHSEACYEECGIQQIGGVIEHLKEIVFDPGKELGGAKNNSRDHRNGIQVIPIAKDSSGESALATIQGTKNKFVLWILDEMAQMNPGVTRPCGNLAENPHFHFIGIGNANEATDPHGEDCMPDGGLESLSIDVDRRWVSSTGKNVLFLHGEETPNNHPYVNQEKIVKATDYPFPYASKKLTTDLSAREYGRGNIEEGKNTVDYWKFCIGFWAPASASSSLYSANLFNSYGATQLTETLFSAKRSFGGGDFGFSAGGDENSMMGATVGRNDKGDKIINFWTDTQRIKANATSKDELIKQAARGFVDTINNHGIAYKDFGCDTGNDGALTMQAMMKYANTYDFYGISSLGSASDSEKYANKVTELWFLVRYLIQTGCCRGVNKSSNYYKQIIKRKYMRVGKKYQIEPKKEMKKRIGRSPDDADAFIYLCNMIIRSGLFDEEIAEVKRVEEQDDYENANIFSPNYKGDDEPEDNESEYQLTEYGNSYEEDGYD